MRTKDNIQEIQRLVNSWSEDPFFVRNDDMKGKNLLLLLSDREQRVQSRYSKLEKKGGEQMQ